MKVLVYVEGPSDRDGLAALLRTLVDAGRDRGVGLTFHPQGGKTVLLNEVPRKAAGHLVDRPNDWIVALPDLYPMRAYAGTPNAHRSVEDLARLLRHRFEERADELGLDVEPRTHFRVHCLKHDLEALVLATPDLLRRRLGTGDSLAAAWRQPVEEQNDDHPPKHVLEALFRKYRRKPGYVDTSDARWILERADLAAVEEACPQSFAPFVTDLKRAMGLGE